MLYQMRDIPMTSLSQSRVGLRLTLRVSLLGIVVWGGLGVG